MAIEKMKKLRLMAVRSQKEDLLKEMMLLGCVQITEPEQKLQDPEIASVVKRESTELTRFKAQHASLTHAVELLGKYAPVKSGLLSARPEIGCEDFLDYSSVEDALKMAEKIEGLDEKIKKIGAEESRVRGMIESLKPWEPMDVPIDYTGTEKATVLMGMLPAAVSFGEVQASVAAITEEAELFLVSADKDQQYMYLVCLRDDQSKILETLRSYSFSSSVITGEKGTARQCIAFGEQALGRLAEEKKATEAEIVSLGDTRENLKLCADRLSTKIGSAEAEENVFGLDSAIVLEGWLLAAKEKELESVFEKYDCAWETEDPTEDEYPEVPVKLRNNSFTNAMNMVTNMYSLPAYNGVDPNPLMAPFFVLFYGLMFADMGYGILMIIAGLLVIKKARPRAGMLSFAQLMLYCGISAFVIGALTGGFFSDAPLQIAKMINPNTTWTGLPAVFSPMNDSVKVLVGAMVLGVVQLNVGLGVSLVKKIRRHEVIDAILYEVALWIILIGIVLVVLLKNTASIVVLCVGAAMLFAGAMRGKKGIGMISAIFGVIYNEATGWFGDILSYSRIMALMLAGSVIGVVFNTIAAMTGNIIGFTIIFIVGHALNFGLNLLGCYVHDLRLQVLEYFGKFYEDGGKAFQPLEINTKYYDIAK